MNFIENNKSSELNYQKNSKSSLVFQDNFYKSNNNYNCFNSDVNSELANRRYFEVPKVQQISFFNNIKSNNSYNNTNNNIITKLNNAELKKSENFYHPITQKYKDSNLDNSISLQEHIKHKTNLVKSHDNSLLCEHSYNLLNFNNKLYPLEKNKVFDVEYYNNLNNKIYNNASNCDIREVGQKSSVNYNILSVKPFNEHHFNKPELRPVIPDIIDKQKGKRIISRIKNTQFNVLSGKYNNDHILKSDIDRQVHLLEAANKYYEQNPYNSITNSFNDITKEIEFQNNEKEKLKHLKEKKYNILPKAYKE